MSKPIMTDIGLFTGRGGTWLISNGEFPFDDCDDRCTNDAKRERVIKHWQQRVERWRKTDERRRRLGMTWAQYYASNS